MKKKNSYDKSVYQSIALVFQFGLNMLVPIGMMLFLGMFLDQLFHTNWIVVLLFFIGAAAGFTNIFKMAGGVYKRGSSRTELSDLEKNSFEKDPLPENYSNKNRSSKNYTNEELSRQLGEDLKKAFQELNEQ